MTVVQSDNMNCPYNHFFNTLNSMNRPLAWRFVADWLRCGVTMGVGIVGTVARACTPFVYVWLSIEQVQNGQGWTDVWQFNKRAFDYLLAYIHIIMQICPRPICTSLCCTSRIVMVCMKHSITLNVTGNTQTLNAFAVFLAISFAHLVSSSHADLTLPVASGTWWRCAVFCSNSLRKLCKRVNARSFW